MTKTLYINPPGWWFYRSKVAKNHRARADHLERGPARSRKDIRLRRPGRDNEAEGGTLGDIPCVDYAEADVVHFRDVECRAIG
jgi:hypothetical protein